MKGKISQTYCVTVWLQVIRKPVLGIISQVVGLLMLKKKKKLFSLIINVNTEV